MTDEILWILFELVVNIYESFLLIIFLSLSLEIKRPFRKHHIAIVIGGIAMTIIVTVLNHITIYEGFLGIIYSLCFFVFSLIFLNGTILKKIFISIFTNVVLIGVSTGLASIMSLFLRDSVENIYTEQAISRFLTVVIVQATLTYVFGILHHLIANKIGALNPKEWILILSVLGISFITFVMIHVTALDNATKYDVKLLMFSELGIILVNIVCWYMTINISSMRKREEELLELNKHKEYSIQYAQTVKMQYEQTRRLRHDMKQFYTILDKLISDNKLDEAKSFIADSYQSVVVTDVVVDVGNDYINALLNAKLTEAKSVGISVICSVTRDIKGYENADLCNLIGNLLDNAIEAAKKCDEEMRSIEFNLSSSDNRLNIIVRNSIKDSVITNNQNFITTKKNKFNHGYGMKTIKFITEKYGGTTDFYEEGNIFVAHIVIYQK